MDGIVLLSKYPGQTSFSSLFNVKKALKTNKVGHTGTLDSFAQGLLVVCAGRLTKLAGNITEFDKEYKAVIKFGEETDTLDYTGEIIRYSELPEEENLRNIVKKYIGPQKQIPPNYSAIHIDGKRASDLVRSGKEAVIPPRDIIVYNAEIEEVKKDKNDLIKACLIKFSVSKGTYIRALARDIANDCGSAGHLIGLYRTRIGNFKIEDAAGIEFSDNFSIESCYKIVNDFKNGEKINFRNDEFIQKEIIKKLKQFDEDTAKLCGFCPIHLKDIDYEDDFKNGKPVMKKWFTELIDEISFEKNEDKQFAVYSKQNLFCGLIKRKDLKHFKYLFVIN